MGFPGGVAGVFQTLTAPNRVIRVIRVQNVFKPFTARSVSGVGWVECNETQHDTAAPTVQSALIRVQMSLSPFRQDP